MSKPKDPNKVEDDAQAAALDERHDADLAAVQEKAGAVLAEAAGAVREIEDAADEASGETSPDAPDKTHEPATGPEPEQSEPDAIENEPLGRTLHEERLNEDEQVDDLVDEHDGEHDGEHEDDQHGSLAGKVLTYLVVALVAAGLALWAAPKLAPHVPASIAHYLVPADNVATKDITRLEEALAEQSAKTAASAAELEDLRAQIADMPGLQSRLTDVESALEIAAGAQAEAKATGDKVTALEAEITGLRAGLDQAQAQITALAGKMSELADAPPVISGASPEDLEKIESQRKADVALRSAEIAALAARVDALTRRVVGAETETAAAQKARDVARSEVESAVRAAELRGAAAALTSRLASGESYADALGTVESLSKSTAPDELKAGAGKGFLTSRSLLAGFSPVARRALAADVQAGAEDTTKGRLLAWLQSQVAGRPTVETAGDDVGAILSRISARLKEDDPAAALAEAEKLPEHAQQAMGGWLDQLRGRVAAERAMAAWLGDIGVNG